MQIFFTIKSYSAKIFLRALAVTFLLIHSAGKSVAQCPANIDFESGTFDGWVLYNGTVSSPSGTNIIQFTDPGYSDDGRHSLINSSDNEHDLYGGFSTSSPNGSTYSVKLGNDNAGSEAEGMSFDFTIPAGVNTYNITYYYAVVFQDPGHTPDKQPRLDIEVTNLTDNTLAGCSSFSFIASSGLPGFFQSPKHKGQDSTVIWCRDWAANSINLDGNAGKTFRLFFKTADCVPSGHFGYAYIDVASTCSSSFAGAAFCPGDTSIDISGPSGFHGYRWFDQTFSQVLGTEQTLHLSPPPSSGTNVLLEVTPYPGYGCTDTLTAVLIDTLTVHANAGGNKSMCDTIPIRIGSTPVAGLIYKWTPGTGLSDSTIANPYASPDTTTIYTLKVSSVGGGCVDFDQAKITKQVPRNTISLIGSNTYCTGTGQSSVLQVYAADSIQWYRDGFAVAGAHQTQFIVTVSGDYNAMLFSAAGCSTTTAMKHIDIYPSPHASFSFNNITQCSPLDSFIVTNQSSIASGAIQYLYDFGDGSTSSLAAPVHNYSLPGSYTVRLHTAAAGGCTSDTSITVLVKPGAAPDFTAGDICIELKLPIVNNTKAPGASSVNYLWDFGNGDVSNMKDPVYSYSAPGNYTVTLTAFTPQCPDPKIKTKNVIVTSPAPGIRYADHPAIINFHEPLEARRIGISALWNPATYLDNAHSYTPMFRSDVSQLYNISLTTREGCVTTDTLFVKTYKKIAINVPTAFTPNRDGVNDVLRPLLFGFRTMNYFRVYNRWGKLVFETTDDQKGWDGTINGIQQDVQTVIWVIEATDVDGKVHKEQGTSVIMR